MVFYISTFIIQNSVFYFVLIPWDYQSKNFLFFQNTTYNLNLIFIIRLLNLFKINRNVWKYVWGKYRSI